eukprot:6193626-Pleurochrysis_carterae.AAC.2
MPNLRHRPWSPRSNVLHAAPPRLSRSFLPSLPFKPRPDFSFVYEVPGNGSHNPQLCSRYSAAYAYTQPRPRAEYVRTHRRLHMHTRRRIGAHQVHTRTRTRTRTCEHAQVLAEPRSSRRRTRSCARAPRRLRAHAARTLLPPHAPTRERRIQWRAHTRTLAFLPWRTFPQALMHAEVKCLRIRSNVYALETPYVHAKVPR